MIARVALLALFAAGCVTPPQGRCADCTIVDANHPYLRPLKNSATTLFILMPGGLGYGWEWDRAVAKLRSSATADFVVFDWDPFRSLEFVAHDFSVLCRRVFMQLPSRIENVVIVAHSAAGLVAAHALGDMVVPPSKNVALVTIGTPFAGMGGLAFSLPDPVSSPVMVGIFGTFVHYPATPPMLKVIEYITSYPPDPVMEHRFGHDPTPTNVGPSDAVRIVFPKEMDHNIAVEVVIDEQLKRLAK